MLRKVTIDPTLPLTIENQSILSQVFKVSNVNEFYLTDKPIAVLHSSPDQEEEFGVFLTRMAYFSDSYHLQILNTNPIHKSINGCVFINAGTVIKNEQGETLAYEKRVGNEVHHQKRVIKMIYVNNAACNKDKINFEYEITKNIKHLNMEPPVFLKLNSGQEIAFLIMNRLPGKTLIDLINDDLNKLNANQRIDLSIALLEALAQLHDKEGIIHRDLKPDNIHVEMIDNKFNIYIFDFGLSKFIQHDDNHEEIGGSLIYTSPEAISSKGTTVKSDIHAMALIIGSIFDAMQRDEPEQDADMLFSANYIINNYRFSGIFDDTHDLNKHHKNSIMNMLLCMYKPKEPDNRLSIAEAISILKTIKYELSQSIFLDSLLENAQKINDQFIGCVDESLLKEFNDKINLFKKFKNEPLLYKQHLFELATHAHALGDQLKSSLPVFAYICHELAIQLYDNFINVNDKYAQNHIVFLTADTVINPAFAISATDFMDVMFKQMHAYLSQSNAAINQLNQLNQLNNPQESLNILSIIGNKFIEMSNKFEILYDLKFMNDICHRELISIYNDGLEKYHGNLMKMIDNHFKKYESGLDAIQLFNALTEDSAIITSESNVTSFSMFKSSSVTQNDTPKQETHKNKLTR